MERLLGPHSERIFAITRIVIAFLFFCHGAQKFGWIGNRVVDLMSERGVAAFIEVVGGGLIALGAFTRIVAFITSGEMAVAYFMVHAPQGFFPLLNLGEPAVFFCFFFLYLASRGAGIWSVDAAMRRDAGSRAPLRAVEGKQ